MTASNSHSGEEQARRLEQVYEQVASLLRKDGVAAQMHVAHHADDWSIMQILGHMVEMIPYWLHHCQRIITAPTPPTLGRTADAPERLAGIERGKTETPEELRQLLHDEVQRAAQTIRHIAAADREKIGSHLQRGEMRVADIIEVFIVTHAESHLAQMQAALQG